jgi:hypothetical protein
LKKIIHVRMVRKMFTIKSSFGIIHSYQLLHASQ